MTHCITSPMTTEFPAHTPQAVNVGLMEAVEKFIGGSMLVRIERLTLTSPRFAFLSPHPSPSPLRSPAHLAHEANTEQTFSLAGRISDPNMEPSYLGSLTSIASNRCVYKPHWKAILKLYRSKYTKAGKLEDEEELLEELLRLDAEEEVAALAAQED